MKTLTHKNSLYEYSDMEHIHVCWVKKLSNRWKKNSGLCIKNSDLVLFVIIVAMIVILKPIHVQLLYIQFSTDTCKYFYGNLGHNIQRHPEIKCSKE